MLKIEGLNVLFFLIYGYLVCALNARFYFEHLTFPDTEISVFGIAMAILLGFRNNEAYNRFWEARTAWGDLTNASRNFASQVMAYVRPPGEQEQISQSATADMHRELIYRHLAFLNALRLQLRQEGAWEQLKPFLSDAEFQALNKAANKATQLNHRQSLRMKELYRSGWIEQPAYVFGLMESIKAFFAAQGRCERIKNTPLPRQYGFFTKSFVWIFVLLLPYGLVQHLGWGAFPIYVVLATIFTITERIGSRTEEPFERKLEDVPMSSICRNIEIDLRQQLGESSVPTPIEPEDGVLM
ncbi:MAG: bestrophin family ion channel [Nitrosomonas sp.]|nr:bestrophin family ion channel [Nitrosomonas sp.]MDP1949730.1 bestrophin family ion channel [Nitrosomonas sp.]